MGPTAFAEGEPLLLVELLDKYIVEGRFAARTPGASLYLTHAVARDGSRIQMLDSQKFKLFLVPWMKDAGFTTNIILRVLISGYCFNTKVHVIIQCTDTDSPTE